MSNLITPPAWQPGVLCDEQIASLATACSMIEPFVNKQVSGDGIVSYGPSPYGYDVRISDEFKVISPRLLDPYAENHGTTILDPTDFKRSTFKDVKGPEIIIPPHGFILAKTMEVVNIPRDLIVICMPKSTWSRCGLIVHITPLNPGFEGTITLELSNTTHLPIRVKAGHGICQLIFLKGSRECRESYADLGGQYMHQTGVTAPLVKE